MRGFRRGGPVARSARRTATTVRLDLRHSGADGPMVAPGKYQVRLTAGSWSDTKPLEVKIDPRVTADGVTQADLEEQTAFLLKVRDAMSEAARWQGWSASRQGSSCEARHSRRFVPAADADRSAVEHRADGRPGRSEDREGSADPVRRPDEGAGADQGGGEVANLRASGLGLRARARGNQERLRVSPCLFCPRILRCSPLPDARSRSRTTPTAARSKKSRR